jgi:predicted glycogen debranching enzyme
MPAASSKKTLAAEAQVAMRPEVEFGREVCGLPDVAEQREWLVTNGIGGYASGSVAGCATRRYHGLLMAALKPPVGRLQLVAACDTLVRYGGAEYALATHRWTSGAIDPRGYQYLESFRLEGTTPVWRFALADALLEQRVWMRRGENTTYVQLTLLRGSGPIELKSKVLVNYRDFHSSTHAGEWRMNIEPVENGVRVTAFDGASPFYLRSASASCEPRHDWYRNCFLPLERYRGLDDREDHLLAALFRTELAVGQSVTFVFSVEADALLDGTRSRAEREAYEADLLAKWTARDPKAAAAAPGWVKQLVLAADQFIVRRALPDDPDGRSVIAGYHWFGDWGRDAMIALPGLTLTTGRPEIAQKILLAFAKYADRGMLPNNFPDAGGQPEYNTVDAALWYFEAARQYYAATNDGVLLAALYPLLARMIEAHVKGTRYQIHVDSKDGLLYAGEPGVQLTWMDAKVGDWVVTPRIGKPVEINALWYNALLTMAKFARLVGQQAQAKDYERFAAGVRQSFQKFWNSEADCCFDVIDSPGIGNDASLRPNQIFAVSLPHSPLTGPQQKAIVDFCAQRLLTSHGLRSLAPGSPQYIGRYGGGPRERDAAYHQGTTWGWLMGPFVQAHLLVYQKPDVALSFLEPLGRQIHSHGLGTLSEIFDGDAPFAPRGCIAQAWTVGEVLRAWQVCASFRSH